MFRAGVVSDAFESFSFGEYTEGHPKQSWFFQNDRMCADGRQKVSDFATCPFATVDVVTVELQRAPGVVGVLRVRVAGKTPRKLRVLPREGMLYPIVCLHNNKQRMSMVGLP